MQDPMQPYESIHELIASVEAPHALRERVAAERDRTLTRRVVVKRMKLTGVLAGGAAVLGAVFALLAPSGNVGTPSSLQVASLATRPLSAAAPAVDPSHPRLLRVAVGGVPFPVWSDRFPWKPSGERADAVEGRTTRTVFYDNPAGVRLGYTIVDGAALPWPGGARTVVRRGVEVHVLHHAGRVIATWREHGHSCVISAPDSVPESRMIALASARSYIT
jgi:hypothetical protein